MLEDIEYAAKRMAHHGIVSTDQKKEIRDFFQSIQDERDQAIESELKLFLKSKLGSDRYKTIELAKDRGEFLTFQQVNKVEYKFDGKVVFSVEVKSENNKWFCDVLRYY